jgi:iron(III) transport system permease protein
MLDFGRWPALLATTAAVSGTAAIVAVVVGALLAVLIARTDLPGRRLLLALLLLAACVPGYVTMTLVVSVVPLWRLAGSALAAGGLYALVHAPLAALILAAALRRGDRELEDLARLDAGELRVLWSVTFRQCGWALAAAGLVVALLVSADYSITDLLTVRTFAEEVYTQFALQRAGVATLAPSLPLLALGLGGIAALWLAARRGAGPTRDWPLGAPPRTIRLRVWRWPLAGACALVVLAVAAPVGRSLMVHIESFQAFVESLAALRGELTLTATLALLAAAVIVGLSIALAWAAVRTRVAALALCCGMVLLLASPAPVIGISLIELLNHPHWGPWLYDTPASVVLGYVVRFLPLAIVLLCPAVQRIPVEMELAARLDGCDWLHTQRHIVRPLVRRDAATAFLVVCVLCVGELPCTMLLAPPGWTPVSVRSFTLLHFGVYRDLAVLAIAAGLVIVPPWLGLVLLLRRGLESEAGRVTVGDRS